MRLYLQPITALSTTEAEYIDVTEAAKEALWLKTLALEMSLTQETVKVHAIVRVHCYLHRTLSIQRKNE